MKCYGPAEYYGGVSEQLAVHYSNYLNTPMAICLTDPEGVIIEANRSFLQLYGYELEHMIGRTPRLLKSGRQAAEVYAALWEAITDPARGFWSGELINRKRSGEEVYVLLTISSAFRPDGTLIGYIASTQDITERKTMEIELEARNRELEQLSRFKSEMIAITSHDLKSPLNAMIGYADLVVEDLERMAPEKIRDFLSKISGYGRELTKFIGELLDRAKIEAGKFQLVTSRVRLDAVLRGCIEINQAHCSGRNVRINYHRYGKSRTAVADVLRMTQVFNNILSNAVKFSPDRGEITVVFSDEQDAIVITIEDQGQGIPEEDLEAIFDQYYQVVKPGHVAKRAYGAGIGLSVVKSIVALHGGMVRAENLSGQGCRFTITLPHKTLSSLSGLALLILDPGGVITDTIAALARTLGAACFSAKSCAEATRIIEYEHIDIVFIAGQGALESLLDCLQGDACEPDALSFVCLGEEACQVRAGLQYRLPLHPDADEVKRVLNTILERKKETCSVV